MRLLVIGGSDAGIAAALRARELDSSAEVTVVVADAFPNFSICGLPYYLSGDVADWRDLAHRTTTDLDAAGLRLLLDQTARAINPAGKHVTVTSQHGERQLGYDRLVIGTGAVPVRPPIDGLDLDGGACAAHHGRHLRPPPRPQRRRPLSDHRRRWVHRPGDGRGFTARGLAVTLVEQTPTVMPTVDIELGRLLGEELRRHDVQVVNDVTVKAIHQAADGLTVAGEPDFTATADLVLVVVGVRPDTDLAMAAGVQTGCVGRCGSTGACAPTCPICWPPATAWRPTIGCWRSPPTCRLAPPRTSRAASPARPPWAATGNSPAHWAPRWSRSSSWPWPAPASAIPSQPRPAWTRSPLARPTTTTRPTTQAPTSSTSASPATGRPAGCSAPNCDHRAEVAKRIDIPAGALFHHMTVDGLSDLDLSYTPPFGSPWDATQLAVHDWARQARTPPA
jgi:hypothetical protein